jgi:hypothetical protein
MGIATYSYNRSTSGGEIITHLVNSTDGQGLDFANGALLQLTYAAGGVFGTADFSIEFIINQSSANSNNKILYTSGGSNEFQITSDTGSSEIELTFDGTDYNFSYDMSADYGSPVHYVMTFDRSALATLYKDGNSVATVDISGSSSVNLDNTGTAAGYLGGVSNYGVTGVFYRWRTWKKLLSAAEVTACYENASVPITDQWSNCVTDLDFAFANPEMSLQIQSRSGAGDATASVGISQVTPIEQLNSKSARIGTTAATVADGDLRVSGFVGVNCDPDGIGFRVEKDLVGQWVGLIKNTNASDGQGLKVQAGSNATDDSFRVSDVSNNTLLQVNGAGSVGIQESVPKATIHVKPAGNGWIDGLLLEHNTGNTGWNIHAENDSSNGLWFGYNSATNVASGSQAAFAKLKIDSAGKAEITAGGTGDWALKAENTHANGSGALIAAGGSASTDVALEVRHSGSTTALKIDGTGLTTVSAITETNGVLRSNLLSNSGFDVWSNSTLEDATGTELAVDGTFSDTANWTEETGWAVSGGNAVATSAAADKQIYQTLSGLTVGKLYKAVLTCSVYGSGNVAVRFNDVDGPLLTGTGTSTVVVEATTATPNLGLINRAGSSSMTCSSITLKEVTPGIVSGTAGPDGWAKSATVDIFRQHSDATYTKNGSFYSAKIEKGASGLETVYTPPAAVNANGEYIKKYAGRTVTFGAWIYSVSATDNVKISIYDDVSGYTLFPTYASADNWQWQEVTLNVPSNITTLKPAIYLDGDATDVAYISQPTLVYGAAIGSGNYSKPSGEIIYNEVDYDSVSYADSGTLTSNTTFNSEAESLGRIPKGAKAVQVNLIGSPDAVGSYEAFLQIYNPVYATGLRTYGNVVGNRISCSGWVHLNADGEYRVGKNQNFSELKLTFLGVQM